MRLDTWNAVFGSEGDDLNGSYGDISQASPPLSVASLSGDDRSSKSGMTNGGACTRAVCLDCARCLDHCNCDVVGLGSFISAASLPPCDPSIKKDNHKQRLAATMLSAPDELDCSCFNAPCTCKWGALPLSPCSRTLLPSEWNNRSFGKTKTVQKSK